MRIDTRSNNSLPVNINYFTSYIINCDNIFVPLSLADEINDVCRRYENSIAM